MTSYFDDEFKTQSSAIYCFRFLKGPLTEQSSSAGGTAQGSNEVCYIPGAFLSESPTISDARMPFDDVEEEEEEEEYEEVLVHDDEDGTNDPLEDSTGGLPSESTQVGCFIYIQFC